MRVLVTGGAGFIGSHISDRFLAEGWEVRVLDNLQSRVHPEGKPDYISDDIEFIKGDVRDRGDWERALVDVDMVLHQAAYQDYVPDYHQFLLTNAVGTALLFEVIGDRKLPIRRVVVASSQAVYGEGQYECIEHGVFSPPPRTLELLEKSDWEVRCPECDRTCEPYLLMESQANPLSPYGLSKYAQEMSALRLGEIVGVPTVALRYSITQGPRQSMFNQYSGIARIFTLCLLRDEAPIAFEDGRMMRDYVHIHDVVEANWLVSHDDRAVGNAFNVGGGIGSTVLEYASMLADELGKDISPQVPGIFRVGDARHSISSIEKLKALGWEPKRTLRDILRDFTCWVMNQGGLERFRSDAYEDLLRMEVLRKSR